MDEDYDLALWDVECRLVCDEALEAFLWALLHGDLES